MSTSFLLEKYICSACSLLGVNDFLFFTDIDNFYTSCWPLDWLVPAIDVPVRVLAVDYEANWWHWGDSCPEEALG